jgi:hypothetical protein
MVQIVIYEIHGDEVCMIGWTNKWVAYRPTEYLQAMVEYVENLTLKNLAPK